MGVTKELISVWAPHQRLLHLIDFVFRLAMRLTIPKRVIEWVCIMLALSKRTEANSTPPVIAVYKPKLQTNSNSRQTIRDYYWRWSGYQGLGRGCSSNESRREGQIDHHSVSVPRIQCFPCVDFFNNSIGHFWLVHWVGYMLTAVTMVTVLVDIPPSFLETRLWSLTLNCWPSTGRRHRRDAMCSQKLRQPKSHENWKKLYDVEVVYIVYAASAFLQLWLIFIPLWYELVDPSRSIHHGDTLVTLFMCIL